MLRPNFIRFKRDKERNDFKTKKVRKVPANKRLIIETLILLTISIITYSFINTLPVEFDISSSILRSIETSKLGISLIFQSITGFSIILLVILLILFFFLILSGVIWRSIRILSRILKRRSRNGFKR